MRLRPVHVLIGAVALLLLGAGAGSAILAPVNGKRIIGPPQLGAAQPRATVEVASRTSVTPAPSRSAVGGLATLLPSPGIPNMTPVSLGSPLPASTQVGLGTPIQPALAQITTVAAAPTPNSKPAGPAESVASPQVKAPVPTDVPIPTVSKDERIGGPVSVPNDHDGPRWVTLQIGHYRNENFPEELSHLVGNTGASAAGVREVDLNEAMARKTAALLIERGYKVDILDATVPIGYVTDLFLALHADGSDSASLRGFKATAPWNSGPASEEFVRILYEEYGMATGLPIDPVTSVGMADYYAFNPVTYRHALSPGVPGTLLEMGFVSNPEDRRVMTQEQDRLALGITNAIDRYFRSGAAGNTPTPYASFTPTPTPTYTPTSTSTATSTSTSTPEDTATPVPTEFADSATATAALITPVAPTQTPRLPTPTRTPVPTPTPMLGIVTSDGRWLPPLSPHVRGLPQPGSSAAPVLLSEEDDERLMTASGRDQVQYWQQFYMPELGRSVWTKGVLRPVRH